MKFLLSVCDKGVSHTYLYIPLMQKMTKITQIAYGLDNNLSGNSINLLKKKLLLEHKTNSLNSSLSWLFGKIKPGDAIHCSKRQNIIENDTGRWGKVYCHKSSKWEIKARVSQTDGMEITRAKYNGKTVFSTHLARFSDYLLRRSRCKLGPFYEEYPGSFVIGSLYVPHHSISILQTVWFTDDGSVVPIVHNSQSVDSPLEFSLSLDGTNIRKCGESTGWKPITEFPEVIDSKSDNLDKFIGVERQDHICWLSHHKDQKWCCNVDSLVKETKQCGNCYNIAFTTSCSGDSIYGPSISLVKRSNGKPGLGVKTNTESESSSQKIEFVDDFFLSSAGILSPVSLMI